VPSFETDRIQIDKDCPAIYGRLNKKRKWKVKTPVLILIDNNKVISIFTKPSDMELIRAIWLGGE
jgi:hypothetical protein